MQVNPAPILLVHHGSAAVRDLMDHVLDSGHRCAPSPIAASQQHRIWAITDPGEIRLLDEALASDPAH